MGNNLVGGLIAVINQKPRKIRYILRSYCQGGPSPLCVLFCFPVCELDIVSLSSRLRVPTTAPAQDEVHWAPALEPEVLKAQSQLCHHTVGNTRWKEGFCSRVSNEAPSEQRFTAWHHPGPHEYVSGTTVCATHCAPAHASCTPTSSSQLHCKLPEGRLTVLPGDS